MKRALTSIYTMTICVFFGACHYDKGIAELDEMVNPSDTTDKPCDPDSIYFTKDISPILQSNCAFSGCHGNGSAQDGVDISNYNTIITTIDIRPFELSESELYDVITETDLDKRMPPPPANALSSDQIDKIANWIQQGAQNNSCDDCDSNNVSFSVHILPLIRDNCQGCHGSSSPSGGISLTNYNQIQTQALSGRLYGTVSHESGFTPMPYNQAKLAQCKIDQIRLWVDEGALEN